MVLKIEKAYKVAKEKKVFLLINIFAVLLLFGAIGIREGNPIEGIKYILNQIVLIYGQGMLICCLLNNRLDKKIKPLVNYAAGVGVIIVEYLIFMGIFGALSILNGGYVLGILGLVLGVKRKEVSLKGLNNGVLTIAMLLCGITFIALYIKNAMPQVIGRSGINQDILWSIGNTESLIRSYPPIDSRMSGIPFMYHYFVNIYYAVISATTALSPATLYFAYGYIGKMIFVVWSVYWFGYSVLKSERKAGIMTLIYFFTSCASLNRAYTNGFGVLMNSNFKHLTDGAFGFELSLGLLLTLFVLIFNQVGNKLKYNDVILMSLIFFTLAGTKGPIALMIILALISAVVVHGLLNKKVDKELLTLAIAFGVIFLIIFKFILKSGSGDLNFEIGYIAKDTIIGKKIFSLLGEGLLGKIILIPLHFFLYLPFGAVIFSLWFLGKLKNIKECTIIELVIGAIATIGIICAYLMKHYGHSEIYFLMTAVPFMELAAVELITRGSCKKWIVSLGVAGIIVGGITSFYTIKGRVDIGLKYNEIIKSGIEFTKGYHPNTIMYSEYEGIKWIKDNTTEDAIILSDRYYISDRKTDKTARYFYYSTFSERQFYLEGYFYFYAPEEYKAEVERKKEISQMIYADGNGKLAKEEGIDYLIISKNIYESEKEFYSDSLQKVFDNENISVYKVK